MASFRKKKVKKMKKPTIYAGSRGKFFAKEKPCKTNLSEKQARIKAWETSQKGRPETKENETKQRETYQDIMMR